MKKVISTICAVTLLTVSLAGCTMSDRDTRTLAGAGIGAAAGYGLSGGRAGGAIGGALIGGVIGNQMDNGRNYYYGY